MIYSTISIRYAKSLIDLCTEMKLIDKVYFDMEELQKLLYESYELRNFLKTPQIDDYTKSRLIKQIFSNHFQEITIRFLTLLIRKGRSNLIIYIVHQFITLYREQTGITQILVKTAVKMTDEMKQKIIEKVQKATGRTKIDMKEQIDKSLLGGFILYYDGNSYDASVKRDLDKIRTALTSD